MFSPAVPVKLNYFSSSLWALPFSIIFEFQVHYQHHGWNEKERRRDEVYCSCSYIYCGIISFILNFFLILWFCKSYLSVVSSRTQLQKGTIPWNFRVLTDSLYGKLSDKFFFIVSNDLRGLGRTSHVRQFKSLRSNCCKNVLCMATEVSLLSV